LLVHPGLARAKTDGAAAAQLSDKITLSNHEGQRSSGDYTSGDIFTYAEGDTIPFRFTITGDASNSGDFQVRFTTNDPSGCIFFVGDSFALGAVNNVSGTSPAITVVSTATEADETVVTLHADFSGGAGQAVVNYSLTLSLDAGACSGSSQHSRLSNSPTNGGDVANIGAQNVPVPANKILVIPDVSTVIKDANDNTITSAPIGSTVHDKAIVTGVAAKGTPGGTVTFTLYSGVTDCSNTGVTSAPVTLDNAGTAASGTTTVPSGGLSYIAHYSGNSNYVPEDG